MRDLAQTSSCLPLLIVANKTENNVSDQESNPGPLAWEATPLAQSHAPRRSKIVRNYAWRSWCSILSAIAPAHFSPGPALLAGHMTTRPTAAFYQINFYVRNFYLDPETKQKRVYWYCCNVALFLGLAIAGDCSQLRTYDVPLSNGTGGQADVWQPDDFLQMSNGDIVYIEASSCVRRIELGYVDTLFGKYFISMM